MNYLYNGVELPDINAVWTDKETYPYAAITRVTYVDGTESIDTTLLCLCNTPAEYRDNAICAFFPAGNKVRQYQLSDNGFELVSDEESTKVFTVLEGHDYCSLIWSSHDILLKHWNDDKGGYELTDEVYFAASDPVPVGGATPEYAIIPTADYKAACDAIRAKTGKTDLIKSGDMASEIASVPTGGGGGGKIELVEGAVYKAQETSETNVYIVVDGTALTLTEFFLASFGAEMDFPCYIVDALPDTMEAGSVYIISSSGIAYLSDEGTSAAAYTMGSALSLTDKGWVDDITTIDATDTANYGVYCQRGGVVDVYYTYTDGKFVLKSEVADTDTVIVVDESITYTSGDNLYLHDENGWKGYKIADKYFECTLDISKDTLTLPTELIDALISNSYEKIITEGEYTVNMKVGFATFSTNSHVHRDATFDSGTLDYSRAGNVIGMGFTICNTIVASNRVKIYYIYFNKWDGANTLTLNTASEITYDRGDTITQTVEEIDRSALTAVKCTFTIHTAEQLL